MADVLNRTTKELKRSVHTPDFPATDWVINPDLSAVDGVPANYWKITGDVVSEMSQAEKDAVDADLLVAEKASKIAGYSATANALFTSRYPPAVMGGFNALFTEAVATAKTNRAAYISQLLNWGMTIDVGYQTKKAAITAMTTRAAVAADAWDTAALEAADPEITLANALAIQN